MEHEFHSFYLVWRVGGRAPTYVHRTYQGAEAEAKRLAREVPTEDFVVLGAISAWRQPEVLKIETADISYRITEEEIPF